MAFELTTKANQARKKINIDPIFILKIDGYDDYFSIVKAQREIRIGDEGLEIGDDWVIGGVIDDPHSLDYIAKEFSSTRISQQLEPDKGSVTSVSQLSVRIVDKNRIASKLISPGVVLDEILGRKVWCYMGFGGTAYPGDYFRVFQGNIVEVDSGAGWVELSLSHPDEKKRQKIFKNIKTKLTAASADKPFTTTDVSTSSNTITISGGHDLEASGRLIKFTTTGTLPAPLKPNQKYYGIEISSTVLQVSASQEDAAAGVGIDLTSVGSGTHTMIILQISRASTSIVVESTDGFLLPVAGIFRTFAKIDSEFIEYTGLTPTTFTGVTRGALFVTDPRAEALEHDDASEVSSFYLLEGNCIDLALQIMMSGAGYGITNVPVENFQQTEDITDSNAIYFQGVDLEKDWGLNVGDFITVSGATAGANNFTGRTITLINKESDGSYCIVSGAALVVETNSAAVASFKSQWDVLPDGLSMTPDEVDTDQHIFLKETFLASPEYRFYLDDTLDGKEFIEKQLMVPVASYTLPRATRASMQLHIQPLPFSGIQTLSKENIVSPESIVLSRSFAKNLYNLIIVKYDRDIYNPKKFTSSYIIENEDSKNRIGKRQSLIIEAEGLHADLNGATVAAATASKLLDRYKFGAEYFENVQIMFKDGVTLEPGDAVSMDFTDLQITNTLDGTRKKPIKFFEVINKDLGLNGNVTVSLTDTGFDGSSRIALFSPASYLLGGSGDSINIKPSFSKPFGDNEYLKWQPYIGADVQIRSLDYTTRLAVRKLIGISGNTLTLDSALPFTALDGDVLEFADYDVQTSDKVKLVYAFRSDDENPFGDGGEPYRYF